MTNTYKKDLLKAGIAGAALATVIGLLYISGGDSEKKVRKIRGWTLKAKGEILEHLEKTREVTKEKYEEIVDTVMDKYAAMEDIKESEWKSLKSELKRHWKNIAKELEDAGSETKVRAKQAKEKMKKPEEL